MLRVTWEWIGIYEPALDVANTVAVVDGDEHDLLEPEGAYERWAEAAARSSRLAADEAAMLGGARSPVVALREHIRAILGAKAADRSLPRVAVRELNEASRVSPRWLELTEDGELRERPAGSAVERLVATYARSALALAAADGAELRICPAPSCGMLYQPGRPQQRWCSTQCGTRARVARHYHAAARRRTRRAVR